MQTGYCAFGLWKVLVSLDGNVVNQVQFVRTAIASAVYPVSCRQHRFV